MSTSAEEEEEKDDDGDDDDDDDDVVNVDRSVSAEISQNGVHSLTGMPSVDGTISLSPDSAVRQSDNSIESSENRHVALGTSASLPQTLTHAGTCTLLSYFTFSMLLGTLSSLGEVI